MYKKVSNGWQKHLDFWILDLVCLEAALYLAFVMRMGTAAFAEGSLYWGMILVTALIEIAAAGLTESFKNVLKRGYYQELKKTVKLVILVEILSVFYLYMIHVSGSYSRNVMVMTGVWYAVFAYGTRMILKKAYHRRGQVRGGSTLLIIAPERKMAETAEAIRENSIEPYRLIGVLTDRDASGETIGGVPIVTGLSSLCEYVCRGWVDEALFDLSEQTEEGEALAAKLEEMGVVTHRVLTGSILPSGNKRIVERMGGYTVLTSTLNYVTPAQAVLKRGMDIAGGIVGCLITGILFVILAPMIYISSPGPIFFSQVRVGKNGKRFRIYKFRSMYMDAEERKKELLKENRVKDGRMFKLEWDPRIIGSRRLKDGTIKKGIGNYIRDWSLDEFPQFFNVLKGDMSLVGTRPPTEDEWEKYELHHRARMAIKPGVTGMWQVSGRSNITDFEEVVKLDLTYIREWSMKLDLKILLKTVQVVLAQEGSM